MEDLYAADYSIFYYILYSKHGFALKRYEQKRAEDVAQKISFATFYFKGKHLLEQ